MRRTRRRARYTWLPTIGTAGPGEVDDNSSGRTFGITVATTGEQTVLISELTFDRPVEGDNLTSQATPLGTVLGNEYFLKRIVGKLFAAYRPRTNQNNDPSQPTGALFGAGFFIARANDDSQGADSPIGSASASERVENYSPLSEDTIREPWIWRRTWILGNDAMRRQHINPNLTLEAIDQDAATVFPPSTAGYGSVADGPHIDAKTARRVKQDERLWFVVATRTCPFSDVITPQQSGTIDGYLDFRLLGALRKARQGSAF